MTPDKNPTEGPDAHVRGRFRRYQMGRLSSRPFSFHALRKHYLRQVLCRSVKLMLLSEQFSCLWTQVDLGRQIIDLTKTKNGSARVVRLNATALTAIASLRHPGQPRNTRVFPHVRSKRSFDTRSWFKPCLAAAKITGYVWHCNRHTFCSWLAMSGASIKEIQEAAGHKTITMTARYSHLSPAHLQSVVERIVTPDS